MGYTVLEVDMASVLVIDDDDGIRTVVERTLTRGGHSAFSAESASRAVEILNENEIDVAIVDIVMPGRGGIDLMMELHKEFEGIKILAISGKVDIDSDSFKLLSKQFGALNVLSKPFTPDMLLKAVADVLSPN
jgi:putative two-component system response regulator